MDFKFPPAQAAQALHDVGVAACSCTSGDVADPACPVQGVETRGEHPAAREAIEGPPDEPAPVADFRKGEGEAQEASVIAFTVYGVPIPQGSTKAFVPKGWKRPIVTHDSARTCPKCGCSWIALDDAEPTTCPTCRFGQAAPSTLYDGQPREEREAERVERAS